MKKLGMLMAMVCLALMAGAQEGIKFEHGSWKEITDMAVKSNKIIFVDCYTSWCGPCKKLAREVFPQKEVGEFFNAGFINVKIDMEKGEGRALKEQFGVEAFPTMLFINTDGSVAHRVVGYRKADKLIEEGKIAIEGTGYGAMKKEYDAGNREFEFVNDYMKALKSAGEKEELERVALDILKDIKKQNWLKPNNYALIKTCVSSPDSEPILYINKNKHLFKAVHGSRNVEIQLRNAFSAKAISFLIEEDGKKVIDRQAYDDYIKWMKENDVEEVESIVNSANMRYALLTEDWQQLVKLVEADIKTKGDKMHAQILWHHAKQINQGCDDISLRKIAQEWCKKAIATTQSEKAKESYRNTLLELGEKRQEKNH
ncbi:MAG: thioredoxin domain-containing protein [Bacteroidales bacterium]|nr:thioredoxin domain-containing protein [Bacteroidales bacterium]